MLQPCLQNGSGIEAMNVELGAWSAEPAEKRMSCESPAASSQGCPCGPAPRYRAAFTLLELLAVVAIIGIMSALLTPAVRGLLGVSGPRGGVNTVSAALEQARLSALESGVPSYFGWGPETADTASSAVIVFRDKKEGEAADYIPVTRWLKLPQGVFLESSSGTASVSPGNTIPKLDGKAVSVTAIKFDRFGRLLPTTATHVLRVGSKDVSSGDFKPDKEKSFFELTLQPLTGRALVVDKAMGN
jgi:prepilin-type N-terminal cleavage/methylation domain-containing protein